jgi:hypothetical protein
VGIIPGDPQLVLGKMLRANVTWVYKNEMEVRWREGAVFRAVQSWFEFSKQLLLMQCTSS